ncbi:GNAT family N-acetyltransferase [Clostridium sp. C2-6-12]|uniref:GNAT family N-acetyltransferase n=1 Tax=Clostridium sp. C2-6-12 TaxID=2698832 RepID=UPI00136E64C4|nr:GNAT family N-acetyltransferase [Clostridium sp. C2-6-12]
MEFRRPELKDIDEAVKLALIEYKNECANNKELIEKNIKEKLQALIFDIFKSRYGLVAIEDGKIAGYMMFWGPFEGHFGNVKGSFSPLHGSAFGGTNRKKTASLLFEKVSKTMIDEGIFSFAICKYAHDKEISETLAFNGFGIRCSDAIKDLSEINKTEVNSKCRYEEISYKKAGVLLELKNGLVNHLRKSPIYFPNPEFTAEKFTELCEKRKSRFFVAYAGEKTVGYIEVGVDGETFISEDPDVLNICGTYVDSDYRNSSVAKELLNYTMTKLADEGLKYLGVDCETINPTALHFWAKYFESYTYSFVRRVDERILAKI